MPARRESHPYRASTPPPAAKVLARIHSTRKLHTCDKCGWQEYYGRCEADLLEEGMWVRVGRRLLCPECIRSEGVKPNRRKRQALRIVCDRDKHFAAWLRQYMFAQGEVTPAMVACAAGITPAAAHGHLDKFLKRGWAVRLSRGVYALSALGAASLHRGRHDCQV